MPPNTRINFIKSSQEKKNRTRFLRRNYRIARMEVYCNCFFDRMSKNQSCLSGEIFTAFVGHFLLFVDFSLLSPLLAFFSCYGVKIECTNCKLQSIIMKYDIFRRRSVPLTDPTWGKSTQHELIKD